MPLRGVVQISKEIFALKKIKNCIICQKLIPFSHDFTSHAKIFYLFLKLATNNLKIIGTLQCQESCFSSILKLCTKLLVT